MKLKQCETGHFYDCEKYEECPFCNPQAPLRRTTGMGVPTGMGISQGINSAGNTANELLNRNDLPEQRERTVQPRERDPQYMDWKEATEASDHNRTRMEQQPELLVHCYTTGWLVCVEGPEIGRDYRLRYGFNHVGRSHQMDVCIFEDDGISRGIHCSVVYEDRKNQFLLVPGNGTLTFAEDRLLEAPMVLKMGDRFQIGDTVLEFIPFCREGIKWNKETKTISGPDTRIAQEEENHFNEEADDISAAEMITEAEHVAEEMGMETYDDSHMGIDVDTEDVSAREMDMETYNDSDTEIDMDAEDTSAEEMGMETYNDSDAEIDMDAEDTSAEKMGMETSNAPNEEIPEH